MTRATSGYLNRKPRTEEEARKELGSKDCAQLDLDHYRFVACANVALGRGVGHVQLLQEQLAETMDPVTRAMIQAKIAILEDEIDRRDSCMSRRGGR